MTEKQINDAQARLDKFLSESPQVDDTAYVAHGATLLGAVRIGAKANIWPGAILRADIEEIIIGEGSSIQDGVCIHLADNLPTVVGKYVTVGHRAVLHGCKIGDGCLIGMSSTILDGAEIGDGCIVAAGAVVPPRMKVPAGSMVVGCPAKIKKTLTPEEQAGLLLWAEKYLVVSAAHKAKYGSQKFDV
ncbi:MAG: gamma carbonic anhydrase family protein [Opitutales bacterium]|nr:gamma carbonic anhydrase family protein [Opitutales bacterium]